MRSALPLLFATSLCCGFPAVSHGQSKPAAAGAFATRNYRNLFREAGHSPKEIAARIDTAFQQLFHGDPETQTVYYAAGQNANGPLAYLSDINNRDVRSEGMSYGMMIAVQLNKKAEFDALWNWSKSYMYQSSPTHPSYGFFSWSMKLDGTPNSESPAPDGEEYLGHGALLRFGPLGQRQGYLRLSRGSQPAAGRHEEPQDHRRPHEPRPGNRRPGIPPGT
ncbi:MAG: glycosyl hydrolase family 8 [Paludibaculum sp.]